LVLFRERGIAENPLDGDKLSKIMPKAAKLDKNGRCGSEAAKVALLERMAAFSQKAELNQACLSVLFCSEFGQ
jgi:hypothetical protein